MRYKVGQILFSCCSGDDGTVQLEEHHIRTIRGGRVTAIHFWKGITWVKLSPRIGDWGWAKQIPSYMRTTFPAGALPRLLHSTKRRAYLDELKFIKGQWISDDPAVNQRLETAIRRRLTALKKRAKENA